MNFNFERKTIRGVVVDAGHGGEDPGAVANGLLEKDLNLKAATYIYDRLRELGIPAKMTRTTDETLDKTERVNRILNAFGNNSDVLVLSNHINAGGGDGAEVVYALRNNDTLAKNVLEAIGSEGQNMRKYYQRRLPSDPSKDYYFIHRETGKTEPLLIEYGFIDSPKDDVTQLKNNLLDYAEGVVRAVANYASVPYVGPAGSNYYTVKAGDSLWKIANEFGITVDELIALNNLESNILNIGQILKIPSKEEVTPGEYIVYTVKKNDNLWNIANEYGTTVNDIVQLNNLSSTVLQVGQQLLIPSEKEITPSDIYTVKAGDSLWKIANEFGITVDDLKSANNLSSNNLSVGQKLYIPGKENDKTPPNNANQEITYVVKSGDSLWNIAKKYNISVNELKEYNNLTSNLLQIGQKLLIPNTTNYITYTVKSGDSLWKIANAYGVTVDDLIKLNNLNNNLLSIGQVLLIPN